MCSLGDILFTEVIDGSPVWLRHGKPLAVPGPDVDIHRAEVVVLLVTFGDDEEIRSYKNEIQLTLYNNVQS